MQDMPQGFRIDGVRELICPRALPVDLSFYVADLDEHFRNEESVFSLYISEAEFRESQRFKTVLLRQRFLASRYVLNRVLADLADTPADQLQIERSPGGKPYLRHVGFSFNLSHSQNRFVLGKSGHGEIGVDIETGITLETAVEIAERVLGPHELAHWKALPESAKADAFARYWTLKEAVLKAAGDGLGRDPREIEVDIREDDPNFLRLPDAYGAVDRWLLGFVDTGWPDTRFAYALWREKS